MYIIIKKLCWLVAFTLAVTASVSGQKMGKLAGRKNKVETAARNRSLIKEDEFSKPLITKERLAEISTDYGVMIVKLYDSTPLHRDNFIRLTEQRFYDSLLFHRIINQFMIQGGDPASKNEANGVPLVGGAVPGERIAAEFKPYFFHKKGALAAARDDNPQRASSNCQFYIVEGKVIPQQDLDKIYNERVKTANPSFSYSQTEKEIYNRIGGTPFLDQSYTVFGEVISGLNVIDKIASLPKDASDKPIQNVRMKIRMLN